MILLLLYSKAVKYSPIALPTRPFTKLMEELYPNLASRAHQSKIIPVVQQALAHANIDKNDLTAIAYTQGPGLLGSLLVGGAFAKSFALSLNLPLIPINHMQGHLLVHFIEEEGIETPKFPFLGVTVSGGHTQLVLVKNHFRDGSLRNLL